ncbi:MAG: UMP kinase [Lentisphaerae bacterium]|nr:UMP kinase [Lentisphaerota bacterium]
MTEKSKYKRIVLKLSGEAVQNKAKGLSIDPDVLSSIAKRIKTVYEMEVEIAIVIGGGNIFRGLSGQARGIGRTSGDYMGMLATIINALALQNALERAGLETRVLTAIEMHEIAEPFILRRALSHLAKGRVLILAGGTGNPYFSTDTAAALRASEIGADLLLKATKVDGIYSADPMTDPNAKRYSRLSYTEALTKSLKVMDAAAFSLCMENKIPIVVLDFFEEGSIEGLVRGEEIGTLVGDF